MFVTIKNLKKKIMLPAFCTTQVKKRVKRDLKKREKKQDYEKFASRGFEP